ncbi:DEAD/DEAH box helicase [Photorhabdus heterorhabditis]|uniref:DEAD/DEAH box helicase n=1 Tax=Photorhabdus heterorhabditis TaxID=880156 RepID=UPI0015627172|nr:DEAD/DEAH box helicase [Photorhabdus heterorhabditis]NRN28204.1 DEAD/DEAH box helicase [Photorhabdus heterorhabditis subsp. aluminescens]
MSYRTIIRQLLEIEHHNFACQLKLINSERKTVPYQLCLSALNLLKEISNGEITDFSRQLSIIAVSVLWTHSETEIKDNLRQIITPILSEIGFSPSSMMLDTNLKETGVYSPLSSYFDKIRILAHDLKNQVTVNKKSYTLTSFQTDIWKNIDENKLIGISAPTSAGKSFLIYLKIIDLIVKGASRIIYVVPTLSLISQVSSDLAKLLKTHHQNDIEILNSYVSDLDKFIYVVTQERAIILFSEDAISSIDLLVVDEIQNIERVANEGEGRSKILYDVLIDVRNDIEVDKIILSGPRLKNIGNLGFQIFGEPSSEKSTEAPPVLSLTYSVSKKNDKYIFNQYSPLFDTPLQFAIKNTFHINGFGQVSYTEKFNEYLHRILSELNDDVSVIFSPTSNQARKSAKAYSIFRNSQKNQSLDSLGKYFRDSVHNKYELASIVESGVAYHTGKTPMHVRKSIEHATSEKLIKQLFCTTTLMQGVNLPAKNVVVRNPHLFTRKRGESVSLSSYEFANLRGRAGRLLTDFIGRTIVLDESSFAGSSQNEENSMFPDEYKDISTGYHEIYDRNSDFIGDSLSNADIVEDAPSKALITHIRQMLYRHGDKAVSRLRDVGISIDDSLISATKASLEKISIPKEVVLSNRYWDPLDLDKLYVIYNHINNPLVLTPYQSGMCQNFLEWMEILSKNFPYYFTKFFGNIDDPKYMYGIAKGAENWVREKTLQSILLDRFGADADGIDDKIDGEIEKLTKHVSFGLPMLLKPVADMGSNESSIIMNIELGMYTPMARFLSDRGVPRETAIKISALHNNQRSLDLGKVLSKLNYWERKQVEHLS